MTIRDEHLERREFSASTPMLETVAREEWDAFLSRKNDARAPRRRTPLADWDHVRGERT